MWKFLFLKRKEENSYAKVTKIYDKNETNTFVFVFCCEFLFASDL